VLVSFGDDPNRYTTAKSRKNYAGTSPLTVASGKKRAVLPAGSATDALHALDQWAFCALTSSPGARAFYDQHRAAGEHPPSSTTRPGQPPRWHPARCIRHHTPLTNTKAWAHRTQNPRRSLTTSKPGILVGDLANDSPLARAAQTWLHARHRAAGSRGEAWRVQIIHCTPRFARTVLGRWVTHPFSISHSRDDQLLVGSQRSQPAVEVGPQPEDVVSQRFTGWRFIGTDL